jgi:hypothetical protein
MSTLDDANARMRENLETRTGKTFAAWINIARKLGTDRHSDIVAYLKLEGPMGHGYANMIAHEARKPDAVSEEDPVDALFAGPKIALRPIYDAIVKTVTTFGRDIEFAPKKTCVSLRRAKQFALVQPSTATRVDIGINLKGVAPTGKLEASGTWNGMVSHRVRIVAPGEFDLEVKGWLKQAYDQAG